jgi:hypothetical protein
MTREEAKKIIFSQWQSFLEHNIDYGGISEAYKMAMKALEQQSSDDCISREEAIRVAEQGQIQGYEWEFKKLCNLPSVTPSYKSIKTELEPSEDCISRAKALEMLGDEPENWTDTEKEIQEVNDYRWFKSILEELPPVTPQPRWIPCSERLPKEQDCYLVTTKWKGSHSGNVYIETNMAVFREKPKEWDCRDVIAWMPLPEPYKEESEE